MKLFMTSNQFWLSVILALEQNMQFLLNIGHGYLRDPNNVARSAKVNEYSL